MDITELKGYLETYCKEYLDIKGKSFICPSCGSGTGKNGTPAFSLDPKTNRTTYKCFSCGAHGDLMDLIGIREGITDKKEQYQRANELYGDGYRPKNGPLRAEQRQTYSDTYLKNKNALKQSSEAPGDDISKEYKEYIQRSYNNISKSEKALNYLKDRGISQESIERWKIGYDPGKDTIVIPYSDHYYTTRPIYKDPKSKYIKAKGNGPLFNEAALEGEDPVFIVEAELDAVILEQMGAKALGLGGTGGTNKLLKAAKSHTPLIIWMDKDEPGEEAQKELEEALKAQGNFYISVDPSMKQEKDPGEDYLKDKEKLRENIETLKGLALEEKEAWKAALREELERESAGHYIYQMFQSIAKRSEIEAVKTGYNLLDGVMGGGLYVGLYVIGALSGLGKTAYILQMADQLAALGHDVLYFSLEMSTEELIARSISRIITQQNEDTSLWKSGLGITAGHKVKHYRQEERDTIVLAAAKYQEGPGAKMYISEGLGDIGVKEIQERLERHIEITGRRPIVIVDYLQLLKNPFSYSATDKQILDKNILDLKKLSREHDIPILTISSLNRDSYKRKLHLAAFKESGAIEYSADMVLGLNYEESEIQEEDKNGKVGEPSVNGHGEGLEKYYRIVLKVLKNRKGPKGDVIKYDFYPAVNLFREQGFYEEQPGGEWETVSKKKTTKKQSKKEADQKMLDIFGDSITAQ